MWQPSGMCRVKVTRRRFERRQSFRPVRLRGKWENTEQSSGAAEAGGPAPSLNSTRLDYPGKL